MSMLIPGQNQLAEPSIVTVEAFEDLLAEFKTFVVEYVGARAPRRAAKIKVSLENESELLTLALEAFCVRLQIHERKYNARIKQMLAWWATGSNLDARLADMGLERQLLDPGDPAAFPPVPRLRKRRRRPVALLPGAARPGGGLAHAVSPRGVHPRRASGGESGNPRSRVR